MGPLTVALATAMVASSTISVPVQIVESSCAEASLDSKTLSRLLALERKRLGNVQRVLLETVRCAAGVVHVHVRVQRDGDGTLDFEHTLDPGPVAVRHRRLVHQISNEVERASLVGHLEESVFVPAPPKVQAALHDDVELGAAFTMIGQPKTPLTGVEIRAAWVMVAPFEVGTDLRYGYHRAQVTSGAVHVHLVDVGLYAARRIELSSLRFLVGPHVTFGFGHVRGAPDAGGSTMGASGGGPVSIVSLRLVAGWSVAPRFDVTAGLRIGGTLASLVARADDAPVVEIRGFVGALALGLAIRL